MSETRVYADEFQTSFENAGEMLEFLKERTKTSRWIRKPTKTLKLIPLEKEKEKLEEDADVSVQEILEDTDRNTQLMLKMQDESYPIRNCAIKTILSRAGIGGTALRKLDKSSYAKVVNYCLRVAKGDALIKIADGKVSAVHGGDRHDYSILDIQTVFEMTIQYLNHAFKGSTYMEGSGCYDHMIVTAMWELGGGQKLLDTYREALDRHGIEDKIVAPVLRLATSDTACSSVTLYPMLICESRNRVINLGRPIRLPHDKGATLQDFYDNLKQIAARYQDAITDICKLMEIEIRNPMNCIRLVMNKIGIKKKLINEVAELFQAQNGTGPCTAHALYYAIHEASFLAACEGMQGHSIVSLEEDIAKALSLDWKEYDVPGAVKW